MIRNTPCAAITHLVCLLKVDFPLCLFLLQLLITLSLHELHPDQREDENHCGHHQHFLGVNIVQ